MIPASKLVRLLAAVKVSQSTPKKRDKLSLWRSHRQLEVSGYKIALAWTFPFSSDFLGEGEGDEELSAEGMGAPWLMSGG